MNTFLMYRAYILMMLLGLNMRGVGQQYTYQKWTASASFPSLNTIYQNIVKFKNSKWWNNASKMRITKSRNFFTIISFVLFVKKITNQDKDIPTIIKEKAAKMLTDKASSALEAAIEDSKKRVADTKDAREKIARANQAKQEEKEAKAEKIWALQRAYNQQLAEEAQALRMQEIGQKILQNRKKSLKDYEQTIKKFNEEREAQLKMRGTLTPKQRQQENDKRAKEDLYFSQALQDMQNGIQESAKVWGINADL